VFLLGIFLCAFFEKGRIAVEMNDAECSDRTLKKEKNRRMRDIRDIRRFFLSSFLLLSLVYIFFTYVIGLIVVPNNDMHPRIDQGDLLVFYRLPEKIMEHEVVVFRKNETIYIGRVIACPDDVCEVTDEEQVRINGNRILESDIFFDTPIYEGFISYPLTLGKEEYFLLGDRREGAEDSRYFGPVQRDEIMGTVITLIRRNQL
jgi:signal peptidase I